jgi:HEAT repeat protein
VADALGKVGVRTELVFDTLIGMLNDTKDGPADQAANSLASLEAWDALEKAFASTGPRTRKFIVSAWRAGDSEEPRRIAKIIEALADVDPGVRLAAAGAFLERDVPEAVPALVKAMSDSDSAVSGHARSALERMNNPAAKAALAGGKPR